MDSPTKVGVSIKYIPSYIPPIRSGVQARKPMKNQRQTIFLASFDKVCMDMDWDRVPGVRAKSNARNDKVLRAAMVFGVALVLQNLQLQTIYLDINRMSTQMLVSMQQVANQELADRQKSIGDQYFRSKEQVDVVQK